MRTASLLNDTSERRAAKAHMIGVAALVLSLGLIPWRSADAASGTWPIVPAAASNICYASCALFIGWIRRRSWGGTSLRSTLAMVNFVNPVAFWRARKVLGWSPRVTAALLATVVLLSVLAQVLIRGR